MRNVGSGFTSTGWGALALGLLGAAFALAPATAEAGAVPTREATAKSGAPLSGVPKAALGFVQNSGQWDAKARFMGRGQGVTMWLQKAGVLLEYPRSKTSGSKYLGHAVEMRFLGSEGGVLAGARKSGTASYLNGKGLSTGGKFGRVLNAGVYPGVDFVSYFDGTSPRYDFVVKPGANPAAIRLGFKGASSVRIAGDDSLMLGTVFGEQKLGGLFAYQTIDGKRVRIPAAFKKNDKGEVGFALGAYDRTKALVIDPLVYGTYFGGNAGFDEVRAMTTDQTSGTYVTGYTLSSQFPINAGPFGFNKQAGRDAFLSKLQGDAFANDYSVYIGGNGNDRGDRIDVDLNGNVYVMGVTDSTNFPGTGNGLGGGTRGGSFWLMRFAPDARNVLTPFPDRDGDGSGDAGDIPIVYRFGRASGSTTNILQYVTGFSVPKPEGSAALPTTRIVLGGVTSTGAALDNVSSDPTGPAGQSETSPSVYMTIEYSKTAGTFTVLQGPSGYVVTRNGAPSRLSGVSVDRFGNIYLSGTIFTPAGGSADTSIQTTPTFDTGTTNINGQNNTTALFANGRTLRNVDTFVRKLRPDGTRVYSALLGGSADDYTMGYIPLRNVNLANGLQVLDHTGPTIAADINGNAYVVTSTNSVDFPRTRGVVGPVFTGARTNSAVTKISDDGDEILYSTNLGLNGIWSTSGISVDPRGAAYITGNVSVANTFNPTLGDPPTPNGAPFNPGSIPTTPDAIRTAYTFPTNPDIASADGYLVAINGDATSYLQGTYIGGQLDEGVFAPYTDSFGDTFVFGWTDTYRNYATINAAQTPPPTFYETVTDMNAFITPGAIKAVSERTNQGLFSIENNVSYGYVGANFGAIPFFGYVATGRFANGQAVQGAPAVINNDVAPFFPGTTGPQPQFVAFLRDGFILRYRLSLPLIQSLTLNPVAIPGGDASGSGIPASTTATLTLSSAAPAGGASITITLDRPEVASFNPSSSVNSTVISIAPGETTATFQVYSSPVLDVQNVQIRADYAGNVRVASLSVRPWLQSLTVSNSTSVGGGGDAGPPSTFPTGTVRLEAPAQGDTRVVLSTDSPFVAFTDASGNLSTTGEVIVPSGQQTATFSYQPLATDTVVSARINATLLGVTRSQIITITPARLNRIIFDPNTIVGGSTTTGRVFLDGRAATPRRVLVEILGVAADSGYSIAGSTGDPRRAIVTIQSVSQGPNSNFAAFSLTTGFETANVTRTVRATQLDANGQPTGPSVTGTVVVLARGLAGISVEAESVESGEVVTVTVSLTAPAPAGGVRVSLAQSNDIFPLTFDNGGSELVFDEGQTSKEVTVKAGVNLTDSPIPVTITAFRGSQTNGSAVTDTLTVNPLTYTVTLNPTTVFGGLSTTGTITLPISQRGGIQFNISAPAGSGVTVSPTSIIIPAGSTTGTFTVNTTAVPSTTTVPISVQTGSQAPRSAGVTVRAIQVSSLTLSRAIIRSGETTRLTVTLDGAPSVDTTISLVYSNGSLISFPPVVVRAGQTSVTVTSNPAARVARTLTTSISASLGGNTASTTLTVQR